jgi:hypothetical protein
VPPVSNSAFEFTKNVTAVGDVLAVPDVVNGVSQLGQFAIEKPTLPLDALS